MAIILRGTRAVYVQEGSISFMALRVTLHYGQRVQGAFCYGPWAAYH